MYKSQGETVLQNSDSSPVLQPSSLCLLYDSYSVKSVQTSKLIVIHGQFTMNLGTIIFIYSFIRFSLYNKKWHLAVYIDPVNYNEHL